MKILNKVLTTFFLLLPMVFIDIGDAKDFFIVITFFLIITQSVLCTVWLSEDGGTLLKMYYSFSYIFFGLVPCLEYLNDVVYWGGGEIYPETYALVNMVIFLANVVFYLCYRYFSTRKIILSHRSNLNRHNYNVVYKIGIIKIFIVAIISFITFYYINNGSVISMLLRGGELKESIDLDQWVSSILGTVSRFTPFLIFLLIIDDKRISLFLKSLLFIIAFVCASPFGMARFMVGLLYIPLMIKLVPSLRYGNKLPVTIMASLGIVFPFLENFRQFTSIENLSFLPKYDFFFSGHFDSYQSLARVVQIDFVTYGYQLLGSILFFVPRGLWQTKPIGSGAEVANMLDYSFKNVSMNFYGEGYVNFGFIGVFLFASIMAITFSQIDKYFKEEKEKTKLLIYYVLLPFVYILMRGDLNVATSLLFSVVFSYFISCWAVKTKVGLS
ncbi:O-antigen polysaccharide polymerase Wzy [Vibrio splendidus]